MIRIIRNLLKQIGFLSSYTVKPFNAATLKTRIKAVFPGAAG
jgi:DNA-binding response OmpR family regulator